MKPLELSSVAEVWKSALTILEKALDPIGCQVQIWYPWGKDFRGHDLSGSLPPTELPTDLMTPQWVKYAGRYWRSLSVMHQQWLISIKPKAGGLATSGQIDLELVSEIQNTFAILGEFVKMECLLGLTLRILEARAGERTGHWERVRNLSVAVGRKMGMVPRELVDLELTGLLHDIGKVAIPVSLWDETRPLSPEERRHMETHSAVGAAMIREIPGLDRVAVAVHCHHEKPDGSGYPKGLTAEEIPLNALIVGAVDAFDAMTHYRPYAAERTYKESIQEMMAATGKYDDRVLWALQEVLRSLGILDSYPVSPAHPRYTNGSVS